MNHHCEACVITCIDFRFQKYLKTWLHQNLPDLKYDRVALGGGVYDIYTILKQIEISVLLHKIKKVVLINHEDCGAYGALGTFDRHKKDLLESKRKITLLHPHLTVETYYLHLDGTFEKI